MSGQIAWERIISEMRVTPDLLRWAKISVWDGWIILLFMGTAILIIGLLISLHDRGQKFAELRRQPRYWAWLFSAIACVCWWTLCLHSQNPANTLKLVNSDVINEWQLSPDEVTRLLYHMRTVALAQFFLVVTSFAWISIPLLARSELSHGFRLLLLRSDAPTIGSLSFERESWIAGHESVITGENLYIEFESQSEVVQATLKEPSAEASENWVHLVYNPENNTLEGHLLKEQPERNQEPCFGPDTEQPLDTVETGKCFWVGKHLHFEFLGPLSAIVLSLVVALVFLFLLSSFDGRVFASSPPNQPDQDQAGAYCFEAKDPFKDPVNNEQPVAQLSFFPSDSTTQPGWLLKGELRITKIGLVQDRPLTLMLQAPGISTSIDPNDVSWSRLPPLHIKFLFDLDQSTIYDPLDNPLLPGVRNGVRDEEKFWNELINELVNAFEFNGIPGQSDTGPVYATWKCQNTDPGRLIYRDSSKDGRIAESLSEPYLEDRMRYVVEQCLYNSEGQGRDEDRDDKSKDVNDAPIPPEIQDLGVYNIPQLLVIIRWSGKPLQDDSYEVLGPQTKADSVFIIEIGRRILSKNQIASQQTVFILAPSLSKGFEEPDLQPLKQIVEVSRRKKENLGFATRFPYLLDAETAKAAHLVVKTDRCQSPPIRLTWGERLNPSNSSLMTSRMPSDIMIRLSIILSIVTFLAQSILIVALIRGSNRQ